MRKRASAEHRTRSWSTSIASHRLRAKNDLEDNPSFKARIGEAVERAYRLAGTDASGETGLPLDAFPGECPYDWTTIMERDHALDA